MNRCSWFGKQECWSIKLSDAYKIPVMTYLFQTECVDCQLNQIFEIKPFLFVPSRKSMRLGWVILGSPFDLVKRCRNGYVLFFISRVSTWPYRTVIVQRLLFYKIYSKIQLGSCWSWWRVLRNGTRIVDSSSWLIKKHSA